MSGGVRVEIVLDSGVLVAGTLTSAHTIRIEPPLIISYELLDEVLNRLEDTLKDVSRIS